MAINLKAIAEKAVNTAFDISADIGVVATYHRITPGAYDVDQGVSVVSDQPFTVNFRAGVFSQREIDGDVIQAGDKKILVKTSEMDLQPTKDDYLVQADGTRFDLVQIGTEPSGKLLIFRGRAHGL